MRSALRISFGRWTSNTATLQHSSVSFFLLSLIDVYDRSIIDYHMGLSCEGKHAAQILQRALWKRQLFEKDQLPVVRTDNGPQFISHAFEEACLEYRVEHERIPRKTPNKNAHVEAFHAILEQECLSRHEFESQRRIHGSLYDLSPQEFHQAARQQTVKPLVIKV